MPKGIPTLPSVDRFEWMKNCKIDSDPEIKTPCVFGGNGHSLRYYYERIWGPIPNGLYLLHRCDRGKEGCMNPRHWWLGTQSANMYDMVKKRRNVGSRKLNNEQIRSIRSSDRPINVLAGEFNVRIEVIRRIRTFRTFKEVL